MVFCDCFCTQVVVVVVVVGGGIVVGMVGLVN